MFFELLMKNYSYYYFQAVGVGV